MITISTSDLPFLRFVKRHQLASSCLRRISEHPMLTKLERGDISQIELSVKASKKELVLLTTLSSWWDKAEYQGISIQLLDRLLGEIREAVAA